MGWTAVADMSAALRSLSGAMVVMTAAYEGRRAGMLASGVSVAAFEPASVVVAVPSGHRLAALIRDGRSFGVSLLNPSQRLLIKKIRAGAEGDLDPFDTLETRTLVSSCPLLTRALAVFDCEVVRHLDLEADHELYVGRILAAGVCADAQAECARAGESVLGSTAGRSVGEDREDGSPQPIVEHIGREAQGVVPAGRSAEGLGGACRECA